MIKLNLSFNNLIHCFGVNLIESYSFGSITINGKTYSADVIIYQDIINDRWWRKSGHLLQIEDLKDIIVYNPEILIVGTGAHGLMKISDETKNYLKLKGIELITADTEKACKIYNDLKGKRKVVGAFHLTC